MHICFGITFMICIPKWKPKPMNDKTMKLLDEDVIISLSAKDPHAPENKIFFDGNTREFVSIKLVETMIDHLNIESTSILKTSAEAKRQIEREEQKARGK